LAKIAYVSLALLVVLVLSALAIIQPTSRKVETNGNMIKHVVVIMQENHSFDNYFALFPNANGISNYPQWAKNLSHPISSVSHDLCHSHTCMMKYYDNGKMDGWKDNEAFGYYRESDISYYWKLARNYTLLDNYFSDFMGPTLPNRIFSIAGDNFGITNDYGSNKSIQGSVNSTNIFDILTRKNITWVAYVSCQACNGNPLSVFKDNTKYLSHEKEPDSFIRDIKSGKLPSVVYYETPYQFSEHPTYSVQEGMAYIRNVIGSLIESSFWKNTVIILTYDESGGFYDHVAPPNASYGFRVPAIIISPFSKKGFVDHTFYSHSSILAFIERIFNLPCMHRDCLSNPLSNSFTSDLRYAYLPYFSFFQTRVILTQESKIFLL
jgi:phospholipase C